jgi:multiple sugar transport system permease protein
LFITIPILGFFIFYVYPAFFALYSSFFKFNNFVFKPLDNPLDNYARALKDPMLRRAYVNVLEMFVLTFVGGQSISLFLALLISGLKRFVGFFRTIYYFPIVTSVVVIAAIFKWFLRGDITGLVNTILFTVAGIEPIRWLKEAAWMIPAVSMVSIWAGVGGSMIIWTAGLKGVPTELYEAAEIDGANGWRKFWGVTLPMLKPVLMYQLVLGFIGGMKAFGLNLVLLGEGAQGVQGFGMPATEGITPVLIVYQYGFFRMQMGYASAVAFLLSIVIFAVTLLQFRLFGNADLYD